MISFINIYIAGTWALELWFHFLILLYYIERDTSPWCSPDGFLSHYLRINYYSTGTCLKVFIIWTFSFIFAIWWWFIFIQKVCRSPFSSLSQFTYRIKIINNYWKSAFRPVELSAFRILLLLIYRSFIYRISDL